MTGFDKVFVFWGGLVLLAPLAVLAFAAGRTLRQRQRAKRRVVERPNSHYTAPLVRDIETRHHWQSIPLDRVHEVNRGEVVRLLGKVAAMGVDALRPAERTFLEQVAILTGTPSPAEPGSV